MQVLRILSRKLRISQDRIVFRSDNVIERVKFKQDEGQRKKRPYNTPNRKSDSQSFVVVSIFLAFVATNPKTSDDAHVEEQCGAK